jgi:valyl-tRNA synthetase
MDTWATSSLTPQIVCGWEDDPDLFSRTFPMDLRPQGPEIIRTWLFSTVLRSVLEHGSLPFGNVSINGWILDPDRKKMSKSKGNVVTPAALIDEHGADGLRYWACSAAPGVDTAADPSQMRVGRRLAIKLLNVTRFLIGLGASHQAATAPTEAIDVAMLTLLRQVIEEATAAFEEYEYQRALERAEAFFWHFCDDFVELVKQRAYGSGAGAESARSALAVALEALLRLFAPFLPFATEEAWSWWHDTSVHREPWPSTGELGSAGEASSLLVLDMAALVLAGIRKAKTAAQGSMRTPVARLTVVDVPDRIAALRAAISDVVAAGVVGEVVLVEGDAASISVDLEAAPSETASAPTG